MQGKHCSKKDCYYKAIDATPEFRGLDESDADVLGDLKGPKIIYNVGGPWYNLGVIGGGTIGGKCYSEKDCHQKSLSLDPFCLDAWANLAKVGGGQVGGKD